MKRNEVQKLVDSLVMLIKALPASSTLETLEAKALEDENVYETQYTRDVAGNTQAEYLDAFFYDRSQISVIADSESYTLEINPDPWQTYTGERLITIKRNAFSDHKEKFTATMEENR